MLTLSNLKMSFGSRLAVDDLSIVVRGGEIFGLLGPNGAGKTTTVSMAVGLLTPDSGTVEIEGAGSPAAPAGRRLIGVAPQILALYDDLTGQENLAFFGGMYGLAGRRLTDRVGWALDFVGLTDRRGDRVKTYSGGMKRRLNLAVSVVHDPKILLLDEPTVGVDPQSRNAIFDNIEALRGSGRAVLYTTHYMEEAQRLCDRLAIMDHGRVLANDTVAGLLAAHGGKSVVIAERNGETVRVETDDPMAELSRMSANGTLRRFSVERPDLEAVFLEMTGRRLRD